MGASEIPAGGGCGVPVAPRRVFGVRFGSGEDAGGIWVARGHPGTDGLRLESVDPLDELPGGDRSGREAELRALVGKVVDAPRSAWGFDFAFGWATDDTEDAESPKPPAIGPPARWTERLVHAAAQPDLAGLRRSIGEPLASEPRATDVAAGFSEGPLVSPSAAPAFRGMVGVLKPLHGRPGLAILPFDPLPPPRQDASADVASRLPHTYVLEVRPGVLLRTFDLGTDADSGGAAAAADVTVRQLVDAGLVRPMPRGLRRRIEPQREAMEALLIAVAAWTGYARHDHAEIRRLPRRAVEGHIYA